MKKLFKIVISLLLLVSTFGINVVAEDATIDISFLTEEPIQIDAGRRYQLNDSGNSIYESVTKIEVFESENLVGSTCQFDHSSLGEAWANVYNDRVNGEVEYYFISAGQGLKGKTLTVKITFNDTEQPLSFCVSVKNNGNNGNGNGNGNGGGGGGQGNKDIVSTFSVSQDDDKVWITITGEDAGEVISKLCDAGVSYYNMQRTNIISFYGNDYHGVVMNEPQNQYDAPAIYRESSNSNRIYIKKSDLKNGYFPNDEYDIVISIQGYNEKTAGTLMFTDLNAVSDLYYPLPDGKIIEITGIKTPVAGEKISDSLKDATSKAKYSGVEKTDIISRKDISFYWSEVVDGSAHLQYEYMEGNQLKVAVLYGDADSNGKINFYSNAINPNSSSFTITYKGENNSTIATYVFGDGGKSFTVVNDQFFGNKFTLDVSGTDFSKNFNNKPIKEVVVNDGSTNIVMPFETLYNINEITYDTFKENKMYLLSIVYFSLNKDSTDSDICSVNIEVGYQNFNFLGAGGSGGNALCESIKMTTSDVLFHTTKVGEPSIDVGNVAFNPGKLNDLKNSIKDIIDKAFYDDQSISQDVKDAVVESLHSEGTEIKLNAKLQTVNNTDSFDSYVDEDSETILGAVDISLNLNIKSDCFENQPNGVDIVITELDEPITLEYAIPNGAKANTQYYIIREHNGVYEKIFGTLSGNKLVFETDRFSKYAIVEGKGLVSDSPASLLGTTVTLKNGALVPALSDIAQIIHETVQINESNVPVAVIEAVEGKITSQETIAAYLDINAYLVKNDGTELSIADTGKTDSNGLPIKIELPSEMVDGKNVKVVRYHDGVAEIVPSSLSGTTLTIKSAKFSTFAIITSNKPVTPPGNGGYLVPDTSCK